MLAAVRAREAESVCEGRWCEMEGWSRVVCTVQREVWEDEDEESDESGLGRLCGDPCSDGVVGWERLNEVSLEVARGRLEESRARVASQSRNEAVQVSSQSRRGCSDSLTQTSRRPKRSSSGGALGSSAALLPTFAFGLGS